MEAGEKGIQHMEDFSYIYLYKDQHSSPKKSKRKCYLGNLENTRENINGISCSECVCEYTTWKDELKESAFLSIFFVKNISEKNKQ